VIHPKLIFVLGLRFIFMYTNVPSHYAEKTVLSPSDGPPACVRSGTIPMSYLWTLYFLGLYVLYLYSGWLMKVFVTSSHWRVWGLHLFVLSQVVWW
jgi:hypothetical protein